MGRTQWGASGPGIAVAGAAAAGFGEAWHYRERLTIPAYRIDIRITESFSSNLVLGAGATITMVAREPVAPGWFGLDPRLDVDSARWGSGEPATFYKADDDDALGGPPAGWRRLPGPHCASITAT